MLKQLIKGTLLWATIIGVVILASKDMADNVAAEPKPPHTFSGKITYSNGLAVESGVSVEARINISGVAPGAGNVHYGQTFSGGVSTTNTRTHALTSNFNYGTQATFQVCADDPGTSELEGGSDGDTITFVVNGYVASPTTTFKRGGKTDNFDLVVGTTSAGSADSSNYACKTKVDATAPGPPTNVIATAGNTFADVRWTAPSYDGGASITRYTVTSSPGGITVTTTQTSVTMTGLTNGIAYTFTVTATNSAGTGESSNPSNVVSYSTSDIVAPVVVVIEEVAAAAALPAAALETADIEGMTAVDVYDAIKDQTTSDLLLTLTEVTSAKVAWILELFDDTKASAVVGLFEDAKAAEVIEGIANAKAASIVDNIAAEKAISTVQLVTDAKAASILELVSESRLVAVVDGITETKASGIFETLSGARAATAVENIQAAKAGRILEAVTVTKAAEIISEVTSKKAGPVMDAIETVALTDIVKNIPEATLIDHMPEMTAEKMFAIDELVLFVIMPNVPTEQLVQEIAPKIDPSLPLPVLAQTTPNQSVYTLGSTKAESWSQLATGPDPMTSTIGKFPDAVSGIQISLEKLPEEPLDAPTIPAGQFTNSILKVDVTTAEGSPIALNAVHMTLTLEKTWLTANNIHKWSIELKRLQDSGDESSTPIWASFSSKRIAETEDHLTYTAVVPGFSVLAFTGSEGLPEKNFEVTDLTITPLLPSEGDETTISAVVRNTSGESRVYPGSLWINETIEDSKTLFLEGGETGKIEFVLIKPKGVYNVRVDRLLGMFAVGQPLPTATPTTTATPKPIPASPTPVPTLAVAAPSPTPRVPTPTATATVEPPAPTAVIPTATATIAPPAATAAPPVIIMAPEIPIAPPATPTPTAVPPTATATVIAPTATPIPPTSTPAPEQPIGEDGGPGLTLVILLVVAIVALIGGGAVFFVMRRRTTS